MIDTLKKYNEAFIQNCSHGNENCDICLGIGNFEKVNYPYLSQLIEVAQKYSLRTIVNHPDYCGIKVATNLT